MQAKGELQAKFLPSYKVSPRPEFIVHGADIKLN